MNNDEFIWPIEIGLNTQENKSIISYHIGHDGIYCRKNIFADQYVIYKEDIVNDLPKIEEDLHPIKDNKIPSILYFKTVEFFKYVCNHFNKKLEAFIIIGMNKEKQYFLYVPSQEVQPAHVHASLEEFYVANPGCYIVADIHSHQSMGKYYSA